MMGIDANGSQPLTIERLTTAERVADVLREQLLSGALLPGTPMRDVELSTRAGVSRTTMREALALLAREGLLTHSLHRGMEVARLAPVDVEDIYAARRILERAGAEHLIASPAASVEELERAVASMREATTRRDRRRVVAADVAFHTGIVAVLGNRRLVGAIAGALTELRLVLSVTDRAHDDIDDQLRQHERLLDLFQRRQEEAVAALDDHLQRAASKVCAAVEAVAVSDRGMNSHSQARSTGRQRISQ
jgi:DNA-binding GntR family transcriptional regulator